MHIGVDADTGVVHSLATTPANVHDVIEAHRLLHGGESQVWGECWVRGRRETLIWEIRCQVGVGSRQVIYEAGAAAATGSGE